MTEQSGPEKRIYPRHDINEKLILRVADEQVYMTDISWGGLCFWARKACTKGDVFTVTLNDISMDVRVQSCEKNASDNPVDADHPYQVRCQFEDPPGHPDIDDLLTAVLG